MYLWSQAQRERETKGIAHILTSEKDQWGRHKLAAQRTEDCFGYHKCHTAQLHNLPTVLLLLLRENNLGQQICHS